MRCYRGLTEGLQELKLMSKMADVRPENANWKLERADSGPERADFRPERGHFRPERAWGDKRTEGWKDGRTNESHPVFYRTLSPLGPLPCFPSLHNRR